MPVSKKSTYFLRFKKFERLTKMYGDAVTLEFPANDDETSRVNKGLVEAAGEESLVGEGWEKSERDKTKTNYSRFSLKWIFCHSSGSVG